MLGFIDFIKGKLGGYKRYPANSEGHLDVSKANILNQGHMREQFHKLTSKNVHKEAEKPIADYLANSKPFDDHYRGVSTNPEIQKSANHITDVIKKTKTPQKLIMYRGFQSEESIGPGKVLTHHSITSYGGSDSYARRFHDKDATNHIIKLKVPEGAHAAYIEHISQERKFKFPPKEMKSLFNHGGEQNWVLHPGARVRITHSKFNKKTKTYTHHAELIHDGIQDHESTT